MGGGSTNKPIVFVFGTKEGDVDGRKKNLSAINTQVAYRAHERRREKKSKLRANAKKDSIKNANDDASLDTPKPTPDTESGRSRQVSGQINVFSSSPDKLPYLTKYEHENPTSLQSLSIVDVDSRSESSSSDHDGRALEVWSSPSASSFVTTITDASTASAPLVIDSKLHTSLDPFFRLPAATSIRDRWLLQHYFAELRPNQFGTNHNAIFCPGRDWVSNYVSTQPLCLEWILILAEEHLARVGMLHDTTSIIHRKAKAYNHLNAILNARNMDYDTSISGIMYAAIMDFTRTPLHLKALDRLIRENGGIQGFLKRPYSFIHPEHVMTVYAFAPCEILELTEVETIKARFFDTLRVLRNRAMKVQDLWHQVRARRSSDAFTHQLVDGNGVLIAGNQDDNFCSFVKAQRDCFNSECVRSLVLAPYNSSLDYAEKARHLTVLCQISMILHGFGTDFLSQAMFLKRLCYVAEMSSARDFQGRPRLALGTLLLVVSYVRQEVQNYADRRKTSSRGVEISSAVIDGLKVFGLLKETGRILLVSWLRDWLLLRDRFDIDLGTSDHDFTDEELAGLSSEIIESWYAGVLRPT